MTAVQVQMPFDFTDQDMKDIESAFNFFPSSMSNDLGSSSELSNFLLDERALNILKKDVVNPNAFEFFGNSTNDIHSLGLEVQPQLSPLSPYSSSPDNSPSYSSDVQPLDSSSDEEYATKEQNSTTNSPLITEQFIPDSSFDTCAFDLDASTFFSNDEQQFKLDNSNMDHLFGSNTILPPLPIETNNTNESQPSPSSTQTLTKEEEGQKKKKRRRSAKEPQTKTPIQKGTFTELNRDQLENLDSQEIEVYIKTLSSIRTVPPSEEKELKKIRRLIKNREYAQSSRDKKKQYMAEMESKLADVESAKAALQQRVTTLELENKSLKLQLTKIANAMKRDPVIMERLKVATTSNTNAYTNTSTMTPTAPMNIPHSNSVLGKKRPGQFLFALFLILAITVTPFWKSDPLSNSNSHPKWSTGRVLNSDGFMMEEPSWTMTSTVDLLLPLKTLMDTFGNLLPSFTEPENYKKLSLKEELQLYVNVEGHVPLPLTENLSEVAQLKGIDHGEINGEVIRQSLRELEQELEL